MKCRECNYFEAVKKWEHTPFKIMGQTEAGCNCFSLAMNLLVDLGLITREMFDRVYSRDTLKLFRLKDREPLKKHLATLCNAQVVSSSEGAACGDWVIRFLGFSYHFMSAVKVGPYFVSVYEGVGTTFNEKFDYDFYLTWGGLTCPE